MPDQNHLRRDARRVCGGSCSYHGSHSLSHRRPEAIWNWRLRRVLRPAGT